MKQILLFFVLIAFCAPSVKVQNVFIKLDYEERANTSTWWKANEQVTFSLDDNRHNLYRTASPVCLKVRWDSIGDRTNVWFTDLKIDSLANPI